MKKEKKLQLIKSISSILSVSNNIYLIDISGMNCNQISDFRRICYNYNIYFKVVKNTLLRRAIEKEKKLNPFLDSLKGNTSIMTSEINNLPAKIIDNFRKKYNIKKPFFKSAYIDDFFYLDNSYFNIILNFKSKKELINDIIMLINSPLNNIFYLFQNTKNKIPSILKQLIKE